MRIAAITFTPQGVELINRIGQKIELDHFCKENQKNFQLKNITEKLLKEYEGIIFVGAAGIAVRSIAPYIISKDKDPAVIVIDNAGKFVISLLSGHLGGANELALKLSKILGAIPVITTATDSLGLVAPDIIAKERACVITDFNAAKEISAQLIQGGLVNFYNEFDKKDLPKGYVSLEEKTCEDLVYISNKVNCENIVFPEYKRVLKLVPKNIILGIGCRKDYDIELMAKTVHRILEENNLDKRAVKIVASVEVKKHEQAIIKISEDLNSVFKTFSIEEIKAVQHKYQGSDFVEKTLGIRAVAAPVVELAGGKIILEKIAEKGMTLCIGEINV